MKKIGFLSLVLIGTSRLLAQSISPSGTPMSNASSSNLPKVLQAYPNPVKDVLQTNLEGDYVYHVYSISGKVIRSGVFNKNINLNQIPKGMYTLVVQLYPGTWTIRISKED